MLGTMLAHKEFKERYRMKIDDEVLTLTMRHAFYEHMLGEFARHEDLKATLLEMRTALHGDVVNFEFHLPFILPNRSHKKIDWEALWKCTERTSLLLELCNFFGAERGDHSSFLLSEDPQLMLISTGHVRERFASSCPIEIGFDQDALNVLVDECENDMTVSEAEQAILRSYVDMSCWTTREKMRRQKDFARYGASFMGIRAMVHAGGTPHFIVPGDCACLGASPDEFKYSRSLYSHNMDSPLQQLSMLTGIVSFWNHFLKPKWRARQNKAVVLQE